MAARLLLICVAFTVGLISGKSIGLNLGVIEEGGVVVGVRSHRLSLRCAPTQQAHVEWTYNDVPIPEGDPRQRRYVASNGSLIITKVVHNKKRGETDAGVYQCKVNNSEGAILSSPVKVAVAGMAHEFSRSPSNTTIAEGNLLRLSCYIESTPKADITWFKDGEPLHSNKRIHTTQSELFIPNVKSEDAGSYSCNATNVLINKKRSSHVGEVTVVKPSTQPIAFFLPEGRPDPNRPQQIRTTLRYGEKNYLLCAASGIPRPNIRWIHSKPDGANVTSNTTQNGLKVFTIESVDEDDEGVYTCTATQTVNGVSSSISKVRSKDLAIVEVDVEVPPIIVAKPKSQMYPAAKTIRIDCEVRGSPTPQVIWYKDGVKLHINGRIKQRPRELVLGAAVTQDTGIYQCFANNSAGVATAYGRVLISSVDQPAPPTSLNCTTLSATQVSLSWNQTVKSNLGAFSVHYFPTDGGDEGKDVTANDNFIVEKLEPHTNYTFYVRSYSSKSASEQSKRVICKTDEAVPTGAPKVTLTTTSSHCVTVKWEPPTLALARGTIVSYEIQWKKTTQTSASFVVLPGSSLEYVISGLRGDTEYLVRVIGATALGWPELNEFQAPFYKITTPSEKLSQLQSPSVQLYSVNSTLIEVLWKYENDSSIDGFKITYSNSIDIDDLKTFSVPPFQRSYFIPFKEPSKWHEVSVRAFRESHIGETCSIRYFSEDLLNSKPTLSVPSDLDAFPLSQNTVNVTWTFSTSEMNRHQTRFSIHYSAMHSNNTSTSASLMETNTTFALINGLKPRTYYKIYVQAHGAHNTISQLSNLIACKTLPEVVGLVDNIGWKVLSNSSVELSWNPLPFPVTGYTVFYSPRLTADQPDQWQQVSVTDNKTSVQLLDLKTMDYVVRIRGESGSNHGPMSADTYISLPMEDSSYPNGHIYPTNPRSSDQFLGIVVGISISICCIALCTGSLLYRKKCTKPQAQAPSSLSENGQCSGHCEQSSLASIELKDIHPTSPINGMKLPLIGNGTLPNGNNREKIVRITDNPQGRRGERSSSHSTDEGDSLLSGPELDMEPEEPTQITLLVDSSLVVVAATKETAPDDGFYETHVAAQQW